MTRYAHPIRSDMNAGRRTPDRRPYARLRQIIAAAEAGELQPEPRKDRDMKALEVLDAPEEALSPTAQFVHELIESGKTVRAFEATTSEADALRATAKRIVEGRYAVGVRRVRTNGDTDVLERTHRYNLILTPNGDAA